MRGLDDLDVNLNFVDGNAVTCARRWSEVTPPPS